MEKERRKERYEELYIKNKARQDLQSENVRLQKKHDNENVGIIKATEKYEQITTHVRNLLDRTFRNDPDIRQSPSESHFKKPCRQKTMELVDGSKDDILDGNNNIQNISNSPHKTPKITSDNEDHLKIGKAGSIFKLREESREDNAKLDVEIGQKCLRNANKHADLKIFDQYYNSPTKEYISAVREYRSKPLGHQYDRKRRKKIKFLRPRLRYHVKKFNLVGYRYGDSVKTIDYTKINVGRQLKSNGLNNSKDYIQNHVLEKKQRFQEMKEKRLRLMGIPYKPKPLRKTTSLISKCENLSISSNSEWVPEKDFLEESTRQNDILKFSRDLKPLWRRRTNMPAPKYREPTLRQHPRRRRDYENERVPSEIFDNVVRTSALPHLYKIPIDMINQSNAQIVKKRPYTAMFESRHHHDHWNPTQQLFHVDVHYQPIVVKPEITRVKRKTKDEVEQFREANPPCKKYVEMNLTIPKWNMEELIKDHRNRKQQIDKSTKTTWKITNKCEKQEHACRTRNTRDLDQLDYPGRKEYLEFLHDVKMSIKEKQQQTEIDNSALFEDLAEELQSIESCLTSLSSSICTNLTNDSGSYILMEGQEKIPLDFIRKSLVPFEELQRSRFRAEPIDREKEEVNPFHVLPFSGQMKAQRLMTQAKDRFFTFNTRLKNDMRLRLEVPYQNMEDRMVGNTGNKHKIEVATDVDENYIKQLENRSPVKMFNYKSCSTIIKDALRLKFESLLIQGQMVQSKIYDRFNEQLWSNMHTLKLLYEKLFDKWEKREYDASMAVVYKVKDIYQETDCLKAELKFLERQLVAINMDIVFTEAKWVRCIMLQNFHYLLADQEWRLENDWIHRLPNSLYDGAATETTSTVQLENFEDSIMKRSKVNIRKRDQDDAWAIKSYYEDVYLPTRHTNLIVFPDADSFQGGLERLKTKTFILLLEMHLILAIHTELQGELDEFLGWCSEDLKAKQEYVRRKCSKLYFMKNRAEWLRRRTLSYLDKSIEASFNDEMFLKDHAIIAEVWRRVVPTNMRGSGEQLQSVDMVAMISDVVLELICKFCG